MMNGYRYPAPPPNARPNGNDSGNGGSGNGGSGNGVNSGNATQSQPTPHYAGATEHHPPGIPPGYPAFPHPGMHSSPNAANANAQAAAAAAAMAAASAISPLAFTACPSRSTTPRRRARPRDTTPRTCTAVPAATNRLCPRPGSPDGPLRVLRAHDGVPGERRALPQFRSVLAQPRGSRDADADGNGRRRGGSRAGAETPATGVDPSLHKRFVDAVAHLGIKNAVPKAIMQLMNVEGLTRENVASHLQKYRLYLKRLQGCSESTMENSPSREGGGSGGGSDGARPGGGSGGSGNGSGNGSGSEGDGDGGSGKGNGLSEKGSGAGNSGNGSGNGSDGEPGVNRRRTRRDLRGIPRGRREGHQSSGRGRRGLGRRIGRGAPAARVAGAAGEGAAAEAEGGSDDGIERPSSVERASSGDGSADGDGRRARRRRPEPAD